MKHVYISNEILKEGLDEAKDVWPLFSKAEKKQYTQARILPISWLPQCMLDSDEAQLVAIVLSTAARKKVVKLYQFFPRGLNGRRSNGKLFWYKNVTKGSPEAKHLPKRIRESFSAG